MRETWPNWKKNFDCENFPFWEGTYGRLVKFKMYITSQDPRNYGRPAVHFALSRGRTIRRRENSSVTCFQSHVKIRTNSMDYSVPGNSATKETLITTSPCYPLFRMIDHLFKVRGCELVDTIGWYSIQESTRPCLIAQKGCTRKKCNWNWLYKEKVQLNLFRRCWSSKKVVQGKSAIEIGCTRKKCN